MIGMILLAVLALAIFFSLTDRFFGKLGVPNWVAFLIVLAFAVAAVFPPLVVGSVSLSYAGFMLPLLLGIVAMFAIGANYGLLRGFVGMLSVAGIVLAARITFVPSGYMSAIPSILIVGFTSAVATFIICRERIVMLAALLGGIVLGDFICAMIFKFVLGTEYMLILGQNGIFDTVVLALIAGGITLETGNLIIAKIERSQYAPKRAGKIAAEAEAGEDMPFEEPSVIAPIGDADDLIPPGADDLYDEYFKDE